MRCGTSGAGLIVYVDSSILARAYLPDEDGHDEAVALLTDDTIAAVTGTWTRIEVAGALVRAARRTRRTARQAAAALDVLHADLGHDGPVTVLRGPAAAIETRTLELVVEHGARAIDAWHVAVADTVARSLTARGQSLGFATRNHEQAAIAAHLGMTVR
jgi:uncharacterized protein